MAPGPSRLRGHGCVFLSQGARVPHVTLTTSQHTLVNARPVLLWAPPKSTWTPASCSSTSLKFLIFATATRVGLSIALHCRASSLRKDNEHHNVLGVLADQLLRRHNPLAQRLASSNWVFSAPLAGLSHPCSFHVRRSSSVGASTISTFMRTLRRSMCHCGERLVLWPSRGAVVNTGKAFRLAGHHRVAAIAPGGGPATVKRRTPRALRTVRATTPSSREASYSTALAPRCGMH